MTDITKRVYEGSAKPVLLYSPLIPTNILLPAQDAALTHYQT
jgi:hypothetical protein